MFTFLSCTWTPTDAANKCSNSEKADIAHFMMLTVKLFSGQHRALGSNLSKVRSLKMDNKVWTEPLIQVWVKPLIPEWALNHW